MKQSGIYKIINIKTFELYIGSAENLNRREGEHFATLIKKTHCNSKLQSSFNQFGIKNFKFEILEIIPRFEDESKKDFKIRLVNNREQYYLDTLLHADCFDGIFERHFNICRVAGSRLGSHCSIESYQRLLKRPQVFKKGRKAWNRGLKGFASGSSSSFKKGNEPWNKNKKGIHLSPNSQFKKGRDAWNKGVEYSQIKGEKHFAAKGIIQLTLENIEVRRFGCMTEANDAGYYRRGLKRACEVGSVFKDHRWCYIEDYENRGN